MNNYPYRRTGQFLPKKVQKNNRPEIRTAVVATAVCDDELLADFNEVNPTTQFWRILLQSESVRCVALVLGSQVDPFAGFGAGKKNVITHLTAPLS